MAPVTGILVLLGTLWVTNDVGTRGITLWRDIAYGLQYAVLVVGPIAAAGAAWAVGRERRGRTRDLLDSLPRGEWPRRRSTLAALGTCVAAGYGAATLVFVMFGVLRATWGGPDLSLIGPAWAALLACTLLGFFVGRAIPWAVASPLLGIALFVGIAVPAYKESSPVHFLTPISLSEVPPFYGVKPVVGLLQAAWFLAIGVFCLAASRTLASTSRRTSPLLVTGVAAATMLASALSLLRLPAGEASGGLLAAAPRCDAGSSLRVCVHPAYASLLPQFRKVAEQVIGPLSRAGVSVPIVDQDPRYRQFTLPDGTVLTSLGFVNNQFDASYTAGVLALALVTSGCQGADGGEQSAALAQEVIVGWLLTRAGYSDIFAPGPRVTRALGRFQRLPIAQQDAWVRGHIDSLRSCRLSMAQIP